VFAGRTPVGREVKADVLETAQAFEIGTLSHASLFFIALCRSTFGNELVSDDVLDAGV